MSNLVQIHKNFISKLECDNFLQISKKNFEIDYRTKHGWHAKTNRDSNFEKIIKEKIKKISPFENFYITWINLTEYEDNRKLDLHKDERSECTFTIPLTEDYVGGDFIVENEKYKLNAGDCICFDGSKLLHGVDSVTSGYRASLNVWIKKGHKPTI